MVKYSSARTEALLDSAGPGTCRPAGPRRPLPARPVHKQDADLVVRVPLCEGPFELRVPRDRAKARHPRRHIEESTGDATPAEARRCGRG
jgi:hypothetical protein